MATPGPEEDVAAAAAASMALPADGEADGGSADCISAEPTLAVGVSEVDAVTVRAADGELDGDAAWVPDVLGAAAADAEPDAVTDALAPNERLAVGVVEDDEVLDVDGSSLPPAPTEYDAGIEPVWLAVSDGVAGAEPEVDGEAALLRDVLAVAVSVREDELVEEKVAAAVGEEVATALAVTVAVGVCDEVPAAVPLWEDVPDAV